jgi:hypothetical protein
MESNFDAVYYMAVSAAALSIIVLGAFLNEWFGDIVRYKLRKRLEERTAKRPPRERRLH